MKNIQDHIKRINFAYVGKMREIGVDYINARAAFKDDHTLTLTDFKAGE